ncbi:MAG: endonuclease III [Alphaproteobacteria bacterium]
MNETKIKEIFERLKKQNPEPKTELFYTNAYTMLVAVVLSAQTTDKGVNKVTPQLFEIADTPQKMLDLGLEKLLEHIKTIGLYNNKAKSIIALSQTLITEHQGRVPETREELEKLAGVGRKTANVVLNTAFKKPTIAVDTHVFRVSNRIGLASGKTPLDIELGLEKNIPKEYKFNAHHWLILHGRYVCKAKKPECKSCIIKDLCDFEAKE